MIGLDVLSLPEAIVKAIEGCDADLRGELYGNIVLAGGNTMFEGLAARLQKEVEARAGEHAGSVKILADANRKEYVWIGASQLSSTSAFESMWVSRDEY